MFCVAASAMKLPVTHCATPPSESVLLSIAEGKRPFFRRSRLPAKSPELVAALSALATGWSQEPRATAVLARAALSPDPEILAATDPGEGATRGRGGVV